MPKSMCIIFLLFLALVLVACGSSPTAEQPTAVPPDATLSEPTSPPKSSPSPTEPPADTPTIPPEVEPAPTDTSVVVEKTTDTPIPTESPAPTDTPTPSDVPSALFYNLPPATLTSATGLYASPNRGELIVPVSIPAGETVYAMGRNGTNSHLRVVWNTGVGWVPVSFTNYNGRQDRLSPLPVFEREPPACAIPITTQFGLNSEWVSDSKQKIAVIVDLFRSHYGDFPRSSLTLKANGKVVESSRRDIVEQGQFSLKDVVFSLPQDVQPGDVVGYHLDTSSDEPLTFMATIFSVPPNCKWDID